MFLVDTNIFLELLLDQERAQEVEDFLNKAEKNQVPLLVTSFTLHAIEALLGDQKDTLHMFLTNIHYSYTIDVYTTTVNEEKEITRKNLPLDFDDSLQYYVAQKTEANGIVSFDKDFDKESLDIRRISPKEFL